MSASFGVPFTKMMFDGLMSRWTRPLVCRCFSAEASLSPISNTFAAGDAPFSSSARSV